MNEPIRNRSVGVGIFIMVGLLFLLGGILTIGNLHSTFSKKMTIYAVFGEVNGLIAGNNIWFSGVKIGTVKKVEFYGESQVKVIMHINVESRQYIRKDAKVKVGTDGLIGNKILIIYGGTMASPEAEEDDVLANEELLSTEDMMATFQQNNVNLLKFTDQLANGQGTIHRLLAEDSVYRSIELAANSIRNATAGSEKLIRTLSEYASNLNNEGTIAHELVTDTMVFFSLKNSVQNLQHVSDSAVVFIASLKRTMARQDTPAGVLIHDQSAGADLRLTLANLETSSELLNQNLEALQHSFLLRRFFKKRSENTK